MKKSTSFVALALLLTQLVISQTNTIVNYDFNTSGSYPLSPNATTTGITCSATSSEPYQTYTGVSTTTLAFLQNATSGSGIAMVNSSGTNTRYFLFQLGGSQLSTYSAYKLYFQAQRSNTGANLITVAYSTDGSNYTDFGTSYPVSTTYSDKLVDLSSETALNNASVVYIKLMVSGGGAPAGTIRVDNFQVQATNGSSGGSGNPWQVNGNNVSFMGKVGIGTTSPAFPLDLVGETRIIGNLQVNGEMKVNSLNLGTATEPFSVSSITANNGAKIINFGIVGAYPFPPSTCLEQPVSAMATPQRFTITKPNTITSTNLLDFRNDGTHGYIDFGFNNEIFKKIAFDSNGDPIIVSGPPVPVLKINSACWGDVEIAKGGGFASTGNYFEVGNPTRNGNIASNIFANNRIGQRVTVNSPFPSNYTNPPVLFNSQFFVNRDFIHAVSVFNTNINSNGDETFVVYGDGRTVIGPYRPAIGYMLSVSGKIIAEEVVVQLKSSWPDYVFHKDYKLKPLSEVEQYILKNKHLQNIPSAKEIEANGVTLGNVVSKQMEKIEELTLYLIEQQKQIEELKKQVESLKK